MSRVGVTTRLTEREEWRQHQHYGEGRQQQQDVAAHDGEEAQQALHEGRVRVRPPDQLTGRHLVVLGEIELVEVLVHRVAQVELDVQRDPSTSVAP